MTHEITQPAIHPGITPFEQTYAYRKFGPVLDADEQALEDLYTKEIIREQGFDGLPHVVSRRLFDSYVKAGELEIFRGLTHARYADAFREGDFFVGRGAFGSGAYAVGGRNGLVVARQFAETPDGVILRMTIKRGARIVGFDDLVRMATRDRDQAIRRLRGEQATAVTRSNEEGGSAAMQGTVARHDELVNAAHTQYDDVGRCGAYLGYDIIEIGEFDYYLILNRTAVRVQRENLR